MLLAEIPIKILGIAGSPRKRGNSEILLEKALEGARSVGNVEVDSFSVAGKKIEGCTFCNRCRESGVCCKNDDFNELFELWLKADGLIYSTPIFHMLIPSQLKALIDRLGHVFFAYFNRVVPRFTKAGGVIAQGTADYGGQELALQYLVMHLMTVNCLPVPGDKPDSYVGAAGVSKTWDKGSILEDKKAVATAYAVGRRVAELSKVIKAGKLALSDLPIEYDYLNLKARAQAKEG